MMFGFPLLFYVVFVPFLTNPSNAPSESRHDRTPFGQARLAEGVKVLKEETQPQTNSPKISEIRKIDLTPP